MRNCYTLKLFWTNNHAILSSAVAQMSKYPRRNYIILNWSRVRNIKIFWTLQDLYQSIKFRSSTWSCAHPPFGQSQCSCEQRWSKHFLVWGGGFGLQATLNWFITNYLKINLVFAGPFFNIWKKFLNLKIPQQFPRHNFSKPVRAINIWK